MLKSTPPILPSPFSAPASDVTSCMSVSFPQLETEPQKRPVSMDHKRVGTCQRATSTPLSGIDQGSLWRYCTDLINPGNPSEGTTKIGDKSLQTDDPTQRCLDSTLAKPQLGWEPAVPLQEGLKKPFRISRGSFVGNLLCTRNMSPLQKTSNREKY